MDPIKVKVSGVEYVVPAKYITALRRKFAGKRVAEKGLHIGDARTFLNVRCAGWYASSQKVLFADGVSDDVRRRLAHRDLWGGGPQDLTRPSRMVAEQVCNTLVERLVKQWARDGYLERCGFGRYRRVK